jgi:agmatinase
MTASHLGFPNEPKTTFLRLPASDRVVDRSVCVFGAARGTEYEHADPRREGETSPSAVRRAITAASLHVDHWDFDFDGPLLNDGALAACDLGEVPTNPRSGARNRTEIEAATRLIREGGATRVLVRGGGGGLPTV